MIVRVLAPPPSLHRPQDFTAGRAHYLGDYFATGEFADRMYHWSMSPADDRYDSTTAEMKRAFPKFALLPTDDRRLIPPAPRKLGNGIKAAPGEPTMSPQRVAGMAPFIGRNYATPALCEAPADSMSRVCLSPETASQP